MRTKRKDIIQKGILVLVSTGICLFVIEVSLRIFYPQISDHDSMFRDDESLGWTFIPEKRGAIVYAGEASHYIQINKSGFRDADFQKNFAGKKIMVIGDSFVSNISVGANDVFTEVLEQRLSNTTVMNFGVNGYGQVQELRQLEKWVDEIRPDLVILMIYVRNDFADNIGKGQWNREKPVAALDDVTNDLIFHTSQPELTTLPARVSTKFYHKLHFYHFVSRRVSNMKSRYRDTDSGNLSYSPPELYLCKKAADPEVQVMQSVMTKLIQKISGTLETRQIPMMLAIAPSIYQVEDDLWNMLLEKYIKEEALYDRQQPNKWLKSWGDAHGIITVDLFGSLYKSAQSGKSVYNPNEQHWTKEGNKVVAGVLEQHLTRYFNNNY